MAAFPWHHLHTVGVAGSSPAAPAIPSLFLRTKFKDGFDRLIEDSRDTKRERQTGIVLLGFDRVNGLTRHLQLACKFCLRPAALCAKDSEAVQHRIALGRDHCGLRKRDELG